MVALGRIVLSKRERVVMLEPWEKGVVAMTLHYPYEVRDAAEYFDDIPDIKIAPDMLKLAEHILQSKESDFDPAEFVDHYEEAVVEMLRNKQAGIPAPKEILPRSNVVNLMDALKRSIAAEKQTSAPAKKGRKRAEGQREMLLPIPGKKEPAAPRAVARPQARQKKAG